MLSYNLGIDLFDQLRFGYPTPDSYPSFAVPRLSELSIIPIRNLGTFFGKTSIRVSSPERGRDWEVAWWQSAPRFGSR